MEGSAEAPRGSIALSLVCLACVAGSFVLGGLGVWPLIEWLAYRHFAPEALLAFVPLTIALAALVVSVAVLRRRRQVLHWLLLAVATWSLASSVAGVGGAFFYAAPLRTGAYGLVGAGEGSRLPIDSRLFATVPEGWLAEVDVVGDWPVSLAMAPRDDVLPHMIAEGGGTRYATFSRLKPGADPNRFLELLGQRSEVVTMTLDTAELSGVVRRDAPGSGFEDEGTVDSLDLIIHGDPAVLISAQLIRDELPASAQSDDEVLLRWFVDFIELGR